MGQVMPSVVKVMALQEFTIEPVTASYRLTPWQEALRENEDRVLGPDILEEIQNAAGGSETHTYYTIGDAGGRATVDIRKALRSLQKIAR